MKLPEIQRLFARVGRITAQLNGKAGPGTAWNYTFPDGSTTTYVITNVKTPEEIEDQFANLSIWTWAIKDYFKALAPTFGTKPNAIEDFVNANPALPLCADIANRLKHGELKESRSGQFPVVGRPTYKVPQAAVASLLVTANNVKLDVADPELVEIEVSVTSQSGIALGDGFEFLRDGIAAWESLLKQLLSAP